MLSTYMFDFHVCVYIACICGDRNVLITQLFILPVCYMSSSCIIRVYVICCQLVCLLIMYVFVLEARPHDRVAFLG